jgi:hypothetical protein
VTWFQIFWPWTEPRQRRRAEDRRAEGRAALSIVLLVLAARRRRGTRARNLRQRRADSRGAARFGIFMFLASWPRAMGSAHHATDPGDELGQIFARARARPFNGGICWVYYLAVEPYGRRFWPDALLGWTRLWSGRLRDPRVGRELLIGMTFGALSLFVVEVPKMLASTSAGSCRSSRSGTPCG